MLQTRCATGLVITGKQIWTLVGTQRRLRGRRNPGTVNIFQGCVPVKASLQVLVGGHGISLSRYADPFHAMICCRDLPRPSIPSSTTSCGRKYLGGFMPSPTPAGVPVLMTSPGSRVMNSLT